MRRKLAATSWDAKCSLFFRKKLSGISMSPPDGAPKDKRTTNAPR